MNVVFSPTGIDATVVEFGVGITLLQICQPSTLALSGPLQDRQANHSTLEPSTKVSLRRGEGPLLLRNIQMEDHQVSRMELDLGLREKLLAPLSKTGHSFLEPMMKDLERLCVVDPLIPRLLNHVIESG